MSEWSSALGLDEADRIRWAAAGWLHDALKDAPLEELRRLVDAGWPEPLLHAPACATRLREAGVTDEELLLAIAYHSVGHPDFGLLGIYLYMADFLEPGRQFLADERSALRARLPADRRAVLLEVIRYRVGRLMDREQAVLPASIMLWNRVLSG